ncbi:MAG: MotA/TolQ/ExbB proton channel family protein [Proteobacteria bacterium]|jgi:chemotaxis protein MotA|nr:MotA/TolQ/ExbB proton channel family protein [Pseudomonadota bacterium]
MDLTSIVGLGLANLAIIWAIYLGGSFGIFIDIPSVVLVIGGTAASTSLKWGASDLKSLATVVSKVFLNVMTEPKAMIDEIIKLSEVARRESVFALEKVPVEDKFLKKAITLAADNRPPEVISGILELEISALEERHGRGAEILEGMAGDGPAFGMIGTLIGLVQMLQNMSDPSSIGPAMAVALLTTLYGAVIMAVFCNPMAAKLKRFSKSEATKMSIVVAGVLGIVAGENPRTIREKLESFLPPKDRTAPEAKE